MRREDSVSRRNWRRNCFALGLSAITTGNHAWDKKEILDYFPRERRLLRPANYPEGVPGQGSVDRAG